MTLRDDLRDAETARLRDRIAKLEKINAVLIERAETSLDGRADAFSLFQTTIGLERRVRRRTDELTHALRRLEQLNEELVEARDRAERADRSKTRFLAQAGHDLLQPLAAARLASAALAEMQAESDGRRLSAQVERALASIEGLLKTILDISRLDAGVMVPRIGAVALAPLMEDLATEFAPTAERRGLRFDVVTSSAHVATDPLMLERILRNLVGNALRYTESGRVLVGVRRREAMVRIDVIDTGPGIPDDRHEAIFEEFHREQRRVPDGEVALGLGLSIVRRLAEVLGHRITVESEPGRGSRFSVELAMVEADVAAAAQIVVGPRPTGDLAGTLIAVVDNDPAVREATVELVGRWGCATIAAAAADEAIEQAAALGRRPDLLLVDYHLDEGTGLDALEAMTAVWGDGIPAIVVTADHGREIEERLAANGLELMRKPVRPAELRALVAHMLARGINGGASERSSVR